MVDPRVDLESRVTELLVVVHADFRLISQEEALDLVAMVWDALLGVLSGGPERGDGRLQMGA